MNYSYDVIRKEYVESVDASIMQGNYDIVIYLENHNESFGINEFYINELNLKICIVCNICNLSKTSLLIEDNKIIGGCSCNFFVYDIFDKKFVVNKNVDTWCEDVYKLEDGYFFHGELCNGYFDKDFNLVWTEYGPDIFENSNIENVCIPLPDNKVKVYDWFGSEYIYGKHGLIKTTKGVIKDMN